MSTSLSSVKDMETPSLVYPYKETYKLLMLLEVTNGTKRMMLSLNVIPVYIVHQPYDILTITPQLL